MMKFFGQSTRLDTQLATDRTHLLNNDGGDFLTLIDDCSEDDNIDEEEENYDKELHNESFLCEKCQRHRDGVTSPNFYDERHASSADVIEISVEEEGRESAVEKKKKRKPLKKRVRKGVWRAMRSSWKYLRRGMSGYAPGLASLFTWGVNFNQVVTVRTSARSPR